MKFKKSILQKIFRYEKKCYKEGCGHVFQDGDDYVIYHDLYGDIMLCPQCFEDFESEIEARARKAKQQELKRKREDARMLAEEIVKVMDEERDKNR